MADYTNTASNGATGQATVDLRGLGSSRTLVLVDGKRLMPSDPSNPVADLNQIPAALVDHVEVLTGGASAVYGSDAEAGVVNFVMRKDFEGIELNSQLGINQSDNQNGADRARQIASGIATAPENFWGGRNLDFSVLLGVNTPDGKGNITAYVGYRSIDPVTQKNMDFSACALATSGGSLRCYGSSNGNRWISIDGASAGAPGANWDYYETGTGKAGSGNFVTWGSTANERYNFAAANYIQRPDTRYIAGYDAHYEVAPWATVYSNMMFADDHTLAQIAPSGLFLGTGRNLSINGIAGQKTAYVEVNCNNPLMTAQENQALCGNILPTTPFGSGTMLAKYGASGPYGTGYDQLVGGLWNGAANMYPGQSLLEIGRRDLEGGDRIDDLRHTSYRLVLGVKGNIDPTWSYDLYAQYGTTIYAENYSNEFSVSRVQNALQVNPDGNCVAYDAGIDKSCVPLDIFDGYGSITKSQLNYVAAQGFKSGYTSEYVASGSVTGDLGTYGIKSPWANDSVGVALGTEYRKEVLELSTSRDFQTNDLYGQGGATLPVPVSAFSVAEGFGEVQVPIAQGLPLAENLTFNGGFRYSAYSEAGDTWTYKADFGWQVIDDLKFRASFDRAVRAPTVLELFSPANVDLFGGGDPCAGPTNPKVAANCLKFGVPAQRGSGLAGGTV